MIIKEKLVDISTGLETIIERDETPAETKARLDHDATITAKQAEAAATAAARAALLAKLGITADEAALLLG